MKTINLVCILFVKELLNEENYKTWSVWIKNYLLGQDLWGVIEDLAEPSNPEDKNNQEYRVWRRKNAAALHAIQMSCGSEALSLIMDMPSAKLAWETALATAASTGIIEMAKCMIEKNRNLPMIPTAASYLPVIVALISNKKEMAWYLYSQWLLSVPMGLLNKGSEPFLFCTLIAQKN